MRTWLKGVMWRFIFAALIMGGGFAAYAANNFSLTQGSGTTFASFLISAVEYPVHVLCDPVAGMTQCQTVNSNSSALIDENTSSQLHTDLTAPVPAGTNAIGNVGLTSQYPAGSTPVTASATGTTGATTATLAAVASNYNFVCGYSIRANATAATTVADTLTGIISGTMTHELWVAPLASGIGIDEQIFNPCIPGSAVNTAIAAVSGAPGSGGLVSSTIWGYYKTTSP